jgi:hypothetical protein
MVFSTPVAAQAAGKDHMAGMQMVGYDAFKEYDGTNGTKEFSGIRLLGDYKFSVTVSADYLPYFYDVAYASYSADYLPMWIGEADIVDDGNGVYFTDAFYAKDGDKYEHIASLFEISAKSLRRYNDVAPTAQPSKGDIIFIERKRKAWEGNTMLHTVRDGETLHDISQAYGIRQRSIARFNRLNINARLSNGQTIKIR